MSPTQKKRFTLVALVLAGMSAATFFTLQAIQSNLEYFITPQQVSLGDFETEQRYRIAGLVKKGSYTRLADGITQRFKVTDCEYDVTIQYTGILPDLFREGQAIVSVGLFDNTLIENSNTLIASQVLAKHDENYVPSEAAESVMLAQANKCDTTDGQVSY